MAYDLNLTERFVYHAPTPEQIPRYEEIRVLARTFAQRLAELCPSSPELTRAVNALDETVMLANAAIARHTH